VPNGSQDPGFAVTVNGPVTAFQGQFGDGYKVSLTVKNNAPLDRLGISYTLITDQGLIANVDNNTLVDGCGGGDSDFGGPGVTASGTICFTTDNGDRFHVSGNPVAVLIVSTTGAWGLASLPK
jgi:hypothetical protein